ncbi:MAG: yffH [Rhizobium sp.]|nr:yffH [Rhizobium sp.]
MLILIAGPYRSGTGDDPVKMAANLKVLEAPSHALFNAGHVPIIGEWVALPVWNAAGGKQVGDDLYEAIFHPVAHRLLAMCEGVLRLPGASKGADNDVKIANERGIPVWYNLNDVPGVAA